MTLDEAYAEACRQIGALSVELASTRAQLQQAADRIVELTTADPPLD